MRIGEILSLTWNKADLQGGFIRLKGEDSKREDGRLTPARLGSWLAGYVQGDSQDDNLLHSV